MYMDINLPHHGKLKYDMKNNEKARCFVLLAKFTGRKYGEEATFANFCKFLRINKNWKDFVENIQYDTAIKW